MFKGTGWSAVNPDLNAPGHYPKAKGGSYDDDSAPASPAAGVAPPADLVAAFLQSHMAGTTVIMSHQDSTTTSSSSFSRPAAPALRSSSINSDADGDSAPVLINPFAVAPATHATQHGLTHTPAHNAQQLQQQQAAGKGAVAAAQQRQRQPGRKQRSLLRRLLRGLMVTSASAGLVALGAWGGSLAYRHYMAQLDDRDQLARRVTELKKQEEKLVIRCTSLEQDRQNLGLQLSDASAALSDGAAARSKLQQQLSQANADREETVRLNLNLQRKLTTLEEQHASLSATHKEKLQALDVTLADVVRLDREVNKLTGTVEKLESRCGALEAANVELKRENAALSAAAAAAAQGNKASGKAAKLSHL